MIQKISIMIIVLLSATAHAEFNAYQLPITRNGVTSTKLAYNAWSGEYPGPIPVVTKKTTLNAYKSLRKLDQPAQCTVDKGIYHPWSETKNAVVNYYSLTGINNYVATEAITLSGDIYYANKDEVFEVQFDKGDEVINTFYLSEGWCSGTLVKSSGSKDQVDYFCDVLEEVPFQSTSKDLDFNEQWLYLQCDEGYNAFIEDYKMMESKNVKAGQILGYGQVGE